MRTALRPNPQRRAVADSYTVPAPVKGWMTSDSLADMPPDSAVVLQNWFPEPDAVRFRRGSLEHATGLGAAVETLMTYTSGDQIEMFGAADDTIWDVTDAGAAVATSITAATNARWEYTNFTTPGGHFLIAVNGADDPLNYDGAVWSATPAITGPADAGLLANVWIHGSRLWFAEAGTATAWYLPVDTFGGAAASFELGAVFPQGGHLIAGASWTIDAGFGMDDFNVFVSSEGDVAVYVGTDPSSASTWTLKGVYRIGKPIGRRCLLKVGGDIAVLCEDGVLPLSQAVVLDRAAAINGALTKNIQKAFNDAYRVYGARFGWQIQAYPRGTMAMVNVPINELVENKQFAMNTLTGAWCEFLGQNAICWTLTDGDLYYGTPDGRVFIADSGSADDDVPVSAYMAGAFQAPNSRVRLKQAKMMRPIYQTDSDLVPTVGVSVDYQLVAPTSMPTVTTVGAGRWDVNDWADTLPAANDLIWAGDERVVTNWTTVAGVGYAFSVGVSLTAEGADPDTPISFRLVAFDLITEDGAWI